MAGQLALTAQKDTIITVLNNNAYGDWRLQALFGLARLVGVTEFQSVIESLTMRSWDKEIATRYNTFAAGDDANKLELIPGFMRTSNAALHLLVMQFLLSTNNVTELKNRGIINGNDVLVGASNEVYQAYFRMLGYKMTGNINNVTIQKVPAL